YGSGTDPESRNANAVQRGLWGLGLGAGIGAVAPAAAAGLRGGTRMIADRLTAGSRARQAGLSRPAAELLSRGVDADGLANLQRAGPDAMLAEAGPNTRTMLDTAIQRSGRAGVLARDAVEDRAAGVGG